MNVIVQAYDATEDSTDYGLTVLPDVKRVDTNNVKLIFESALESGRVIKVLVTGMNTSNLKDADRTKY